MGTVPEKTERRAAIRPTRHQRKKLFETVGMKCEVCQASREEQGLRLDYDSDRNVRGVLCERCKQGYYKKDRALIKRALEYLTIRGQVPLMHRRFFGPSTYERALQRAKERRAAKRKLRAKERKRAVRAQQVVQLRRQARESFWRSPQGTMLRINPEPAKTHYRCGCAYRCKYCGAKLHSDPVGHLCPTKGCQWEKGVKGCTLSSILVAATAQLVKESEIKPKLPRGRRKG